MKRIIGCGNLLLQDEGVGIHLIRSLEGKVPQDVELVDGSTGGFDLLPLIEESEKVIIVDAVKAPGGAPGNIYRFTPDDFRSDVPPRTSLHDISLQDVFDLVIRIKGRLPPVVVFGVEPDQMDWGMELTAKVAGILGRLEELVLKEIKDA